MATFLNQLLIVKHVLHRHSKAEDQRVLPWGEEFQYYEAFVRYGFRRRFFVTSKGHLGSGPTDMQAGDQICILQGAKTPFILRERENSTYELVSHAYVHGIMHGEGLGAVMEEVDLKGRQAIGFRKFSLV